MAEWRAVPGYSPYQVSENGDVRKRKGDKWKLLKPSVSHWGYHVINLRDESNVKKQVRVHRLVCSAFIGVAPVDLPYVNHKDGVKTNNLYTNLEWCNVKENTRHASSMGLVGHAKEFEIRVHDLSTGHTEVFEFAQDVCRKYSTTKQTLMMLLSNYPKIALPRDGKLYRFEPIYCEPSGEDVIGHAVSVYDAVTGTEFSTSSIVLAALKTGVSRFGVSSKLGTGKLIGGYLFKHADDKTPFARILPSVALQSRKKMEDYWRKRNL